MSRIVLLKCASLIILLSAGVGQPSAVDRVAREQLSKANADGFILVHDVRSGRVLAHIGEPKSFGIDSSVAPLSVIKVFVAAVWLEHGFGDTVVDCDGGQRDRVRRMNVEEMLVSGCDSAGKRMAVLLRQKIGGARVLSDLRRFGIASLTLKPDATDEEWGRVLSLGEEQVPVTPAQVAVFFAAIGNRGGKLMSNRTARALQSALDAVVQRGTADSIKDALAGTGWHIGGKTGTGPGACADHCDGWFAGLVGDSRGTRYVVLAMIRGKGLGSGVAAHAVASIAEYLAANEAKKAQP